MLQDDATVNATDNARSNASSPTPYSKKFDDVYFSRDDGWAETDYVFLRGNDLPAAWRGKDTFTIFETGFGTGLNVFAACALFEKTANKTQRLTIVSFEKYPFAYDELYAGLTPFHGFILKYITAIKNEYPAFKSGFKASLRGEVHTIKITPQISLRLIIGDINDTFSSVKNTYADYWFLDGFKPASNPDMWSDIVFENMARLSRKGTTFSTFTAAGFVRRGLQGAGFDVQKIKGFGTKREMLTGVYRG